MRGLVEGHTTSNHESGIQIQAFGGQSLGPYPSGLQSFAHPLTPRLPTQLALTPRQGKTVNTNV